MKILVATHNTGKLREYAELLADLPVEWLSLDDVGISTEVEETGETIEENARLKAVSYAAQSGLPTLADDSGLEVDALGGEPGVRSARYSGPGATDADRCRRVLDRLEGVPAERRTARFRCVIAVAVPGADILTAHGMCEGRIAFEPRGARGFGYDPIFWLPDYGATLAELGPEIKNRISHRGRAVAAIRPPLEALIQAHGSR